LPHTRHLHLETPQTSSEEFFGYNLELPRFPRARDGDANKKSVVLPVRFGEI